MIELNSADAVVHLAGANLGAKRWNEVYKKIAYDSRIISTRNLVEAIKQVGKKPKVFICSSATGFYGNRYYEVLDENSSPGNDFLATLCNDWEKEARKVEQYGVRRVSIRTGLVLMKDEGVLNQMLLPFKLLLAVRLAAAGSGFHGFILMILLVFICTQLTIQMCPVLLTELRRNCNYGRICQNIWQSSSKTIPLPCPKICIENCCR